MNTQIVCLSLLLLFVTITQQTIYRCDSNASCGCSLNSASINARIVGGEEAAVNTWSWATSLKIDFPQEHATGMCGGAVISDSYIMTAGHCISQSSAYDITAYFGSRYRYDGQVRRVSRIYLHPQYYASRDYVVNDIALLKLSSPLDMTDRTVTKVCLPKSSQVLPDNTNVIAIGWGRTSEDGSVSETLRQVTLNVINSTSRWCTNIAHDTTIQFCAGIMPYGGKDTCQGDSGGPLMAFNNESLWEIQGIVSYGDGCAEPLKPGVYTRVGYYLNWIESVMKNEPDYTTTTTTTGITTTTTAGKTTTGATTVNMLSKTTSNTLIVLFSCFVTFILLK